MEIPLWGFKKNSDGSWSCGITITFTHDNGRSITVQPGTSFTRGELINGFDVVKMLDEQTSQ